MRYKLLLMAICIFCIITAVSPANATLNQVHKGDTVFIGEEGLVLNSDVFYTSGGVSDTQLAWYSAGNPASEGPSYVIAPSKDSFFVSQADFSGREGLWYSYPNGSQNSYSAINVRYPSLGLKLYAYRSGGESFDITNGKIVSGEALDFWIETNMYPVFSRQGVLASDGGIDVKVKNQIGATLSSLYDCSGNPVKITGIHPSTSGYYVPSGTLTCVWDTGNSAYSTGSYTIWAESDINGMMDNLGEIAGATITNPIGTVQNTETIQAGFTATETASSTTAPSKTSTQTITPTPAATTPAVTAEETQSPEITTAVQTASETKTTTEAQSGQLPQTPSGLLAVFTALAIVSALAMLKRK